LQFDTTGSGLNYTVFRMIGDLYKILNVPRTATSAEIKKAYRKLALVLHPDKTNGDQQKTAKYRVIAQAYATLSNETLRLEYDKSQGIYSFNSSSSSSSSGAPSSSSRHGSTWYQNVANAESRILDPSVPFNEREWNAAHYPEDEVIVVSPTNISYASMRNSSYSRMSVGIIRKSAAPPVNTATVPTGGGTNASSKVTAPKPKTGSYEGPSQSQQYIARKHKREQEAVLKAAGQWKPANKDTDVEYKVGRGKSGEEGCVIH
jgi:curved DNA-binding protein CbpA